MPIDTSAVKAHDPNDPEVKALLSNLQGNILKGHGRDHVINLFVHFTAAADVIRSTLIPLAEQLVTSAQKQHEQAIQMNMLGVPGDLFGGMLFTAAGYRALGFDNGQIGDAFPEETGGIGDVRSNFKAGIKENANELGDPPVDAWDPTFRAEIHMLVLLADDDKDFLRREARRVINALAGIGTIEGTEHGAALRDASGAGIEHFGYADGRSQPIFLSTDLEGEGSMDVWSPVEPLESVLVKDLALKDMEAFGSYYVFRKLEQNVLGFLTREQELADFLKLQGADRERAGAMAVGRFRDGTPLVKSSVPGLQPGQENNFKYEGQAADKCPFHAHIRKTNPRGDLAKRLSGDERQLERARRITRRGIPYGTRAHHPHDTQILAEIPSGRVGLLFACFQASIPKQFAFMQKTWVNASDFVQANTGQDPVIANPVPGASSNQSWPAAWGQAQTHAFHFGHFVTMKGGEFFFAPSIPFLNRLAP